MSAGQLAGRSAAPPSPTGEAASRIAELERELEASRERARQYRVKVEEHAVLRAILEAAPVAIFWTDRSGVYLGSNTAFLKVAGVSDADAIIGRCDGEVFSKPVGPDADQRRAITSGRVPQLSTETKVVVGDAVPRPFMLTVAPLKVTGATGSPINPIFIA